MKRRKLLQNLGMGLVGLPLLSFDFPRDTEFPEWEEEFSVNNFDDEKFWRRFAKAQYQVSDDFTNLENGYFGVQPITVQKAYVKNIKRVNEYSSQYMRTDYNSDYKSIVRELAEFSSLDEQEILITRNATEAMNIIIQGLDLKAGDEVILHKQDYYSMIEAFQMLEKKTGIKVNFIRIPLIPESDEQIIEAYRSAVTPRTKCILVTHLIHLTGQIMPVKKIAEVFRPMGIEIIVDAAHSFAQMDFKLADLGVDFVGVNLHKWFSNPLGVGMLYVNKNRIKDLKPLFGDRRKSVDDIRKLGHFGTLATPTVMTIPAARAFNEMITLPVKEKRLRYLQNYWTSRAKKIERVSVTTPTEPARSCALASFKIEGQEANETVKMLYDKCKVFTVIRQLEDEQVVRVTPNLYNTVRDLDKLLEGLENLSKV